MRPCAMLANSAALKPVAGQRGDAEQHEPHVADAGVGDQPFQVSLGEAGQRAVDDRGHGEQAEVRRAPAVRPPAPRRHRPGSARRCPSSAARRRASRTRRSAPRCARRAARCAAATSGSSPRTPSAISANGDDLRTVSRAPRAVPGGERDHVERAGLEPDQEQRRPAAPRAEQRVEDELRAAAAPPGPPQLAITKYIGMQDDLEEQEEQQQVERDERAERCRLPAAAASPTKAGAGRSRPQRVDTCRAG